MSADGGRRRLFLTGLALFVAGVGYFASYARVGIYDDEGYLIEGVTRLLDGQLIYRDFHHTYAPGRFYLFAALFKLFGQDLMVVRYTWVVMRAAIVVLAWLLARRLIRGPLAWAPPLALLALPGPWHKSFFHLSLLACALAGTAALARGGPAASFAAGAVVGLALLFRQDVGVAAIVAIAIGVAVRRFLPGERVAPLPTPPRPSPALLAAGCAAVVALPLAYFAANGALGPLLDKVFLAGARDNRANALPFPPLLPLLPPDAPDGGAQIALGFLKALYYIPLATFALWGMILLGRAVATRRAPEPARLLVLLLGTAALVQAANRSDVPHLLQAIGLVYFPWAMAAAWIALRIPPSARRAAAPLLALALPLALCLGVRRLSRAVQDPAGAGFLDRHGVSVPAENATGARLFLFDVRRVPLELERARLLVTPAQAAVLTEAKRFLDETTERGDYFLTLPGYQLLYFLCERRNPTALPHVRRAFDNHEEEMRYVAQIERSGTRYIFLQDVAIDGRPERRFAVYAKGVMDWLEQNYRPIKRIGNENTGLSFLVVERIAPVL